MTSIRAEDLRTDPEEVAEWVESFDQLLAVGGRHRAASVLHALAQRAAAAGVSADTAIANDYVNTIPVADEPPFAGDEDLERRWPTAHPLERRRADTPSATSRHRRRRPHLHLRGAATLYEVGLNHFFRGPDHPGSGDQCSSRAMPHPECMPGPTSRVGSPKPT